MEDDTLTLPVCDTRDPADLEAWYGPFGFAEHWRKVVLANCREAERGVATANGEKITEARLDDKARLHPNYLAFLTTHLIGRRLREENVLASQATR